MANRYLQAKQLNVGDELVWYQRHSGRVLRCLWRNTSPCPSGQINLTFVAQYEGELTTLVVVTRQDV